MRNGLGGVMAFSIDMDDFDGDCMEGNRRSGDSYNWRDRSARKYPLLQAMFDTVERGPNSAAMHSSPVVLVLSAIGVLLLRVRMYG